jgi:predicted transcriptional regulator
MTRRIYERFTRSFQNPTKLSILLLLTQKKEMTVTQMSRYIGVTKANLYHSIVELVKDGLVSEPEIQVKRNYIEKYYHLNLLALRAIDPYELQKRLNQGASSTEYKDLLESFFTSFSLYFKIYAHEMGKAPPEKLEQIMKDFKEERLLLSSLSLEDEQYAYELREIRSLLKKAMLREKTARSNGITKRPEYFGEDENKIFIVAMPRSMAGFIS